MNYKTFLIEFNHEEIPPRYIKIIANKFYFNIKSILHTNSIQYSKILLFYTPRRIALIIKKLNISPIVKIIKYRGPAIKNSFNQNGTLTQSAKKWLEKFNIKLKQTKKIKNNKGAWLLYEYQEKKY